MPVLKLNYVRNGSNLDCKSYIQTSLSPRRGLFTDTDLDVVRNLRTTLAKLLARMYPINAACNFHHEDSRRRRAV